MEIRYLIVLLVAVLQATVKSKNLKRNQLAKADHIDVAGSKRVRIVLELL